MLRCGKCFWITLRCSSAWKLYSPRSQQTNSQQQVRPGCRKLLQSIPGYTVKWHFPTRELFMQIMPVDICSYKFCIALYYPRIIITLLLPHPLDIQIRTSISSLRHLGSSTMAFFHYFQPMASLLTAKQTPLGDTVTASHNSQENVKRTHGLRLNSELPLENSLPSMGTQLQ